MSMTTKFRAEALLFGNDGKPDPEPFLLGARRLGVDPAHCVVFEDAPAGLTAGRTAGMRTVALTTAHQRSELVADVVVRDLSAVSLPEARAPKRDRQPRLFRRCALRWECDGKQSSADCRSECCSSSPGKGGLLQNTP
jgi:hypothetical protein